MLAAQLSEPSASPLESLAADASLLAAWQRVRRNHGAPGVDGETIEAFESHLAERLPLIQSDLLAGTFHPQPVRALDVAKPSGGLRTLGIPTVTDRLVLEALAHLIGPLWEPTFSPYSFGFRPGLDAHDAVAAAQRFLQCGHGWVVDLDIEQFFDHVDHVRLMLRLGQRITDARVLDLIADFLRAGLSRDGILQPTRIGIAQGSPLSPLLANIVLDELDQEFDRQGRQFVRYADDCILFARTEADGRKILDHTADFLSTRLHLKLHPQKSRVVQPEQADHLGFTYRISRYGRVRRQVTPASLGRFREHVSQLAQAAPGASFDDVMARVAAFVRGWSIYYGFSEDRTLAAARSFARARLRACAWKCWNTEAERRRELIERGVTDDEADTVLRRLILPDEWAELPVLARALPNAWFDPYGLGERNPLPRHNSTSRSRTTASRCEQIVAYLTSEVFHGHWHRIADGLQPAHSPAPPGVTTPAHESLAAIRAQLRELLGSDPLPNLPASQSQIVNRKS